MTDEKEKIAIGSSTRVVRNARRTIGALWPQASGVLTSQWLVAVTTAIIPLVDAWLFGQLINELAAGSDPGRVRRLGAAVVLVSALIPMLYAVKYFLERKCWHLATKLFNLLVCRKKTELDIATYESSKAQDIFMVFDQEGSWRPANFMAAIANSLWNAVSVGAAFVALISLRPWFCLPLIVGALPALVIELRSGEAMWGIFSARGPTKRRFWHIFGGFQQTHNLTELKVYQNGACFVERLCTLYESFEQEELRVERRKLVLQIGALCAYQGAYAVVLFALIRQVLAREIAIGSFTFLIAAIGTFRTSLSGFFNDIGRLYDHERYVNNIWDLLDLTPLLEWRAKGAASSYDIVVDNVTGGDPHYPEPLFRNLTLCIRHGERVAIVGPNGAGKTTFKRLLQRDFDPAEGRILIGGRDLRDLDEKTLFSTFAFLSQESVPYHFSVKEVIGLGCSDLPIYEDEVHHAARTGGAQEFIEDASVLPLGYEQLLGKPDGKGLSGGQWRRLAISRALYRVAMKRIPILVLDEPTAQVDGKGSASFFRALRSDTSGRTVILMSHLLADIKAIADRIIVLAHGAVVEDGTHEELMSRRGVYYDLFQYQEKGYEAA